MWKLDGKLTIALFALDIVQHRSVIYTGVACGRFMHVDNLIDDVSFSTGSHLQWAAASIEAAFWRRILTGIIYVGLYKQSKRYMKSIGPKSTVCSPQSKSVRTICRSPSYRRGDQSYGPNKRQIPVCVSLFAIPPQI